MQDIQTYSNAELKAGFRAGVDGNGDPWFVASDVAKSLGYRMASDMTRRLDDDEKGTRSVRTLGGTQEMVVITEPGMYRAIMGSTMPTAKAFQRWVTHEVLPSIRRRGGYMVAAADETPEQTMARALLIANDALKKKDARIAELEPKAFFADAVHGSPDACAVDHLAKMLRQNGYNVGRNRLFALLREEGFLCKSRESYNLPTQRAMEMGLFCIRESVCHKSDGTSHIYQTTKVTGKGQRYFIDRYCHKRVAE